MSPRANGGLNSRYLLIINRHRHLSYADEMECTRNRQKGKRYLGSIRQNTYPGKSGSSTDLFRSDQRWRQL